MEARNLDLTTLYQWGLIYMATPYTKYPHGRTAAFQHAARLCGQLLKLGVVSYSPIAHTEPVAIYGELDPLDHNIWLPFDRVMMEQSKAILVAKMAGWEDSFGVRYEIDAFREMKKPIIFQDVTYDDRGLPNF